MSVKGILLSGFVWELEESNDGHGLGFGNGVLSKLSSVPDVSNSS